MKRILLALLLALGLISSGADAQQIVLPGSLVNGVWTPLSTAAPLPVGATADGTSSVGQGGAKVDCTTTTTAQIYTNNQINPVQCDLNGNIRAKIAPSSADGITSVVSAAAENNHVLKASPGNLYSVTATNLTATAGFLVVLNLIASPADGAILPLACVPLAANGTATINYNPGPAAAYSVGITAVVSSATTCFTKTTGTVTAFFSGNVF